MPDPQTKPKKLVKVKDVGVIAFPGHFDDSQIIAAIRAHKAQPTGTTHDRNTNPHFASVTTEQSEHARQIGNVPEVGLNPDWNQLRQYVYQNTQPTTTPSKQGKLSPADALQDINAKTGEFTENTLKRAGRFMFGAVDIAPQTVGILKDLFSSDPETSSQAESNLLAMHPGAQVADRIKEAKNDWQQSKSLAGANLAGDALGFWLTGKATHGASGVPIEEKPSRFMTRVTSSNPMGEVRVGTDNVPSVWLSPKGWDHWMKAFAPEEKGTIPGMSIRADQAAEKMFSSKMDADPEWLHVQKLLGDAHAQANGGNAMNMLRADPSKVHAAFNVLPEEAAHSWQRIFSKNGFLQTHLPNDAWQRTAAKVPSPMKARLAADGYNVNRPSEIVAETAAKFITGDLQGTDPGQASEFLDHYFKEVTDVHGPEALSKLEQTRQATEQLQKEIYAEHQQSQQGRPSAGVPSVAAGRQGRAPEVSAGQAGATPAADLAFSRGNQNRFPNPDIRQGTEEFTRKKGRRLPPPMFAPPDTRALEIADAYSQMKHDPTDPKVKASYDALKHDINEQWDLVHKLGIKPEPWKQEGQPYKNSYEMMKDVRDNKHIWFFQGGDMPADHPLSEVDPKTGLTANDKLRVVHDVFGHAKEGFQFGGRGEENAWLAHQPVFSKEALPALTTETKGQNSWVNYGPHMRDAQGNIIHPGQPGHLAPPDRPYAEQKAGILPERFLYRSDAPVSFMSPNLFTLDMAKAGGRLASQSHKMFSGLSDTLSKDLGVSVSAKDAIGHWQGGAENSVMHHFPLGTDRDTVLYHGAIMGKVARQNYYGAFFPDYSGEGPDKMYAFWVDGSNADPEKIASVLEKHNISGSTMEPAEGGHTVFAISEGDSLLPKIDAARKDLGVKNVEQYEGKREFIGHKDRDVAERNYASTIEEIESRRPDWKRIREGLESRPDYRTLRAFSEHAERVAGTPEEARIVDDNLFRRQPVRTWKDVAANLSDEQKERYDTKEKREKIVAAVNAMPEPAEWDAAVKAGWSGRLWYERSSKAFDALVESQPDMFRKTDKNKFLNFVSALSPVQPVRQNLLMAVNLWDKWNKAGRPVDVIWKDPKKFTGVASKNASLYRILKGGRNAYGVDLPARLFNGIRALQDQPLSGPKVSAFAPNLGEDAEKSTNDTWMAIFGNTDPNQISQQHLYDAMSSLVTEAGKKNNIPTRQAQAAIWSFIKSLAELSGWGKDRWIPPQEIVKQGLLTPELINKHAADFADMLANDSEIRGRIKEIGGDLNALDKKLGKYVPARDDEAGTAHVDPRLLNAAKRLETARDNSRIQAHLERKADNKPNLFDTSFEGNDLAFKRGSLEDLKKEAEERNPKRESPWYLKSEKMIDEKMKGPMTAADVLRMLKNGGIKEDELKWSGLDDFLREKIEDDDLAKVTPEEVKQHLAENAIQIKEVTKGGGKKSEDLWIPEDSSEEYNPEDEKAVTKYHQYQEPGGENYRELLLTLPKLGSTGTSMRGEPLYDYGKEPFQSSHWDEPNVLGHVRFNDRTGPNGEKLLHLEELQSDWHQKGRSGGYVRSREEMQAASDALDASIKRREAEDRRTLREATDGKYSKLHDVLADKDALQRVRDYRAKDADYQRALEETKEAQARHNAAQSGVPDAPFKKTWPELLLKRMIRYASENGYDGISWTPGEEQAARYDLSKQVDEIRAHKHSNGDYSIAATKDAGRGTADVLLDKTGVSEHELEGIVGKDLARKIISQEVGPEKSYRGLDLKVGGEGMKGFYDKIVPDYMNKFGKKWGAKVGNTRASLDKIASNSVYEYDGPALTQPQISQIYRDIKEGKRQDTSLAEGTNYVNRSPLTQVLTQIAGEMGKGKTYHDAVAAVLANNKLLIDNFAKEFGGSARQKTHRTANFQHLPITPEMRGSIAEEGVPLFKRNSSNERFPTEGWYTADGKFRANAHYGQHKTTAIKYKLGKNYDEAWANGHIRVMKKDGNHWGLEAGRNDSNTRERLAEAIQKLPENAWTITIEASKTNTDGGTPVGSSFTGPSARIEALEWVEDGMKKDYGRGMGIGNLAYAFKRESVGTAKNEPTTPIASNSEILTRLKAEAIKMAPAGVLGLSALKAEAERRKPSAIVK